MTNGFNWLRSGPSDPSPSYISHRLAVQADIAQNRLIFPTRSKLPLKIATNGKVVPPARPAQCDPIPAMDVQGRPLPPRQLQVVRLRTTDESPAAATRAQSLCGGTMLAGSPLRTTSSFAGVTGRTSGAQCTPRWPIRRIVSIKPANEL